MYAISHTIVKKIFLNFPNDELSKLQNNTDTLYHLLKRNLIALKEINFFLKL